MMMRVKQHTAPSEPTGRGTKSAETGQLSSPMQRGGVFIVVNTPARYSFYTAPETWS